MVINSKTPIPAVTMLHCDYTVTTKESIWSYSPQCIDYWTVTIWWLIHTAKLLFQQSPRCIVTTWWLPKNRYCHKSPVHWLLDSDNTVINLHSKTPIPAVTTLHCNYSDYHSVDIVIVPSALITGQLLHGWYTTWHWVFTALGTM